MKDNRSSELNILRQLPQVELVLAPTCYGFYKYLNEEQRAEARQTYSQLLRRAISAATQPELYEPAALGTWIAVFAAVLAVYAAELAAVLERAKFVRMQAAAWEQN